MSMLLLKKPIIILFILFISLSSMVLAQDKDKVYDISDLQTSTEEVSTTQFFKEKFVEGGPFWMSLILICFVSGLTIATERIITLNLLDKSPNKLLLEVEPLIKSDNKQQALQIVSAHSYSVARIIQTGLKAKNIDPSEIEKSMLRAGNMEINRLEIGMNWLTLCLTLAPMLGFLGTVVGMIFAFDDIESAGDIKPEVVAHGIKIALITTVGGLFSAIILQILQNYCNGKINSITSKMEETGDRMLELLS